MHRQVMLFWDTRSVQVEEQRKHQRYAGQSSMNIKGSFCQSEWRSIQFHIQSVLGYVSETWAITVAVIWQIGENGTNDGQMDMWCSPKE